MANKRTIIDAVAQKLNVPSRTACMIVDAVLDTISMKLQTDGVVSFKKFGTFKMKLRKGRIYQHPLTRKDIITPDREKLTFSQGRPSKRRIPPCSSA